MNDTIALDIAGLLFECAISHGSEYLKGNYMPSLIEVYRLLIYIYYTLKWDAAVVFDGVESKLKRYERERRERRKESATDGATARVRNEPLYIAMAARICKGLNIPFVVAAYEADSQCKFIKMKGKLPSLVVTGDSDLLAYGNSRVIVVKSWRREEYRFFDLSNGSLVSHVMKDTLSHDSRVLISCLMQHDPMVVLHAIAGCFGCDFTPDESGLQGAGKATVIAALETFVDRSGSLTLESFVEALLGVDGGRIGLGRDEVLQYLVNVARCFVSDACYYDETTSVRSIGGSLVEETSDLFKRHKAALVNPRDKSEFDDVDTQVLDGLNVHNFGHRSWISKEEYEAYALPPERKTIEDCTVPELKDMIAARGGNTVSDRGEILRKPDLIRIMRAYFSLEQRSPTLVRAYNRDKVSSGSFINGLNTKNDAPVDKTLQTLLRSPFMEQPTNRLIQTEMNAALDLFLKRKFVLGIDAVAEISPEITPELIYRSFGHIGESVSQKNVGSALQRVLEQTELTYHAVAFSNDKKKFYILSKQSASMNKDQSTRAKVGAGERPELSQYLVLMVMAIEPTTLADDGHTLGRMVSIITSYCAACVAGLGSCIHCSMCCWQQYHCWGEDRGGVQEPVTMKLCRWSRSSGKQKLSATNPIHTQQLSLLPRTLSEAKKKIEANAWRNVNEGLGAVYSVYSSNDKKRRAQDPARFSLERPAVKRFLKAIRK